MDDLIVKRIGREAGRPELIDSTIELLAENLSGSDFHSLLLLILKRRIGRLKAFDLSRASAVTAACSLDARLLNRLEAVAQAAVPQFKAVELSPLSPLGAVSLLTGLDQANVLSTVRAFECASDPTIGMALECARLRRNISERKAVLRLCASQRVVRFPLPQNPAFTAHFKLFSLVSSGRDSGSFAFETDALQEHIEGYIALLSGLKEEGFAFENVLVEISDTRVVELLCLQAGLDREEIRAEVRARDAASTAKLLQKYAVSWPRDLTDIAEDLGKYSIPGHLLVQLGLLQTKICTTLGAKYPGIKFAFNMHRLTGLGYYQGPCFHLRAKNSNGDDFNLGDGGLVDWSQLLLSDSKERLMTSAIGTELLCRMFRHAE